MVAIVRRQAYAEGASSPPKFVVRKRRKASPNFAATQTQFERHRWLLSFCTLALGEVKKRGMRSKLLPPASRLQTP